MVGTLKKAGFAFFLVVIAFHLQAQTLGDSFFKDGEKVNFIGNSITHGGEFHSYIFLFYATRFPREKVTFYNAGIWGDNANSFLKRMDKDILKNRADYAIVMAGMNDVRRPLYAAGRQGEPDIQEQKQRALDDYKRNLEQVIKRLKTEKLKIILQKPSIYDQTAKIPAANMVGVNDALAACCIIIDALAKRYNLQVVDYYTIMNTLNVELQKADTTATIISTDRIHPGTPGSFVMAYEFLKSTKSLDLVSSIEISKGKIIEAKNCVISHLSKTKTDLEFVLAQKSLPFPIPEQAGNVAEMIAFNETLNKESLKIGRLKAGDYDLFIDDKKIATFSSSDFTKGINLANYNNTPQYIQAQQVARKIVEYRQAYRALRDIKIVEINFLPEQFYGADYETVMKYVDKLKAGNERIYTSNTYYFNLYFMSKPKEAELEKRLLSLREEIYSINQPVAHQYKITAHR